MKFVTGNPGKRREAEAILGVSLAAAEVELEEIQTHDVETAVRHKAEAAYRVLQCPVLVEDSGLVFEAWNGLPGALIKWFEITVGLDGLLRMLTGFSDRRARALCLVAVHDGQRIHVARGEVPGTIADACRGDNGFGWDAIFIPEGHRRTYGEMSAEEKNTISHRRRAFEALKASAGLDPAG